MSSVPPNIVGPILQSNLTQRQVSTVRNSEDAQKANANRQQTAAADASDTTVETDDQDVQVHTDAEGSGSQGRAFSHPEEPAESSEEEADSSSPDGDEGQNIDLKA